MSQYESLNVDSKFVPIRVDEVLYETIETIKQEYPAAAINLEFITVPENSNDLTVNGNGTLLKTAFQNLIKNAYFYSSNQKVSISINIDDRGIEIVFDNKGHQIKNEERDNLFVPFFRGENSVNIKGTGIGLSLVDRIVKLHNGTINYIAVGSDVNRFVLFMNK